MDNVRDLAKRESIYVKTLRAYILCSRTSKEARWLLQREQRKEQKVNEGVKATGGSDFVKNIRNPLSNMFRLKCLLYMYPIRMPSNSQICDSK